MTCDFEAVLENLNTVIAETTININKKIGEVVYS